MAAALEMAHDLAFALDPVAWAASVDVQPDAWQARVLRTSRKRVLLCCSRQAGKSTTVALRAAHRAIYRPRSLILCVSPSLRQSGLLFDKIAHFVRMTPRVSRTEDNKLSLELANGSRVVSLPASADTIRGYSAPSMVLVDEAAFVDDSVYAAVRPMLIVSGGEFLLFSTPFGQVGEFYEAWTNGGDEWERIRVPATECPRITAADLARERREMPAWLFSQEYACEFTATLDAIFTREQVDAAMCDGEELDV